MSTTRSYINSHHLWTTVTTDAGSLAVHPTRADYLIFDAAKASHIPAYADAGEHGSTVLDIGRGVRVRVSGHAEKVGSCWEIASLYVLRDSGGDVSREMHARAEALVFDMLNMWGPTHEGDIVQADDIARNNDAMRLENLISEHATALKILHRELRRCDSGASYAAYPTIPTDRRS